MDPVTAGYREQTLKIRAATYRDILRIWPIFDPHNPQAMAAWTTAAGLIVRRDRARAAVLAQQYVGAYALSQGQPVPAPVPAEQLPPDQLATSLRVTSVVAYAIARRAGHTPQKALQIASVSSSGSAARLALNGGRSVIQQTAQTGAFHGWRRVGNPQCGLCKTILGRIYPASTQSFQCHDHCSCTFEPYYGT